jgi:hypothetical protein
MSECDQDGYRSLGEGRNAAIRFAEQLNSLKPETTFLRRGPQLMAQRWHISFNQESVWWDSYRVEGVDHCQSINATT